MDRKTAVDVAAVAAQYGVDVETRGSSFPSNAVQPLVIKRQMLPNHRCLLVIPLASQEIRRG
jgi:hypothetical protein